MLLYALWAVHTTHSSVTSYMLAELMTGQAPVMPTETAIATWTVLPWKEEMSREELLAVRTRNLEGRPEHIAEAIRGQQEARFRNKRRFDAKHRLQHSSIRKFAKRWFGPYEVWKVFDNGTYRLCELAGSG